jgi:hypothetical protein
LDVFWEEDFVHLKIPLSDPPDLGAMESAIRGRASSSAGPGRNDEHIAPSLKKAVTSVLPIRQSLLVRGGSFRGFLILPTLSIALKS